MKAIIINTYGGPDVLEYKDVKKPAPGPGEVLIQTKFASVNPADWKVRKGKLKLITGKKFPKILGIEGSGIIEEVGQNVTSFKKGQHVFAAKDYTTGTYAEYFKVPEKNVLLLPENMPFEDAASIAVTGVTAYQSLVHHGKLEDGMHVLINGASGGVGIMAVQIAKILGAHVSGVCSYNNLEFVKSLGADRQIDYNEIDFTREALKYDIIVDAAGNLSLAGVKENLNDDGILIKLNISGKTIKEQLLSMFSPKKLKLVLMKVRKHDFQWVRDQIAIGKLKVIIDKIYNIHDCRDAHVYSESLRAKGKILLKI